MPSLKHLTSQFKSLRSFFFAPKQAFTLVELIVVISVLAVLATIAFQMIWNITLSSRNSTRMTNIQSISSSLNIYKATNWTYPIPDNKTDILYSGTTIWYQWYIKDTAARLLKLSPNSSQDPLNTSTYFSYSTNQSRTKAQLFWFLEANNTTSLNILPIALASDEFSTKTPYSKGEELGILYTSWTTTPLTGTSIELGTLTNPYTAYYNSNDLLTWTGNILQNLVISYAHGSGFGSPSTSDCPTGFIPVPGNKDFNQPGFCVAKYEMKQAIGDAGSYYLSGAVYRSNNDQVSPYCTSSTLCNSTTARNFTNPVISKAEGYPIVYINQYNAIEACKAMWAWYHLITNNEWMTIARNIEQVGYNWSSGIKGSGYFYSGHSDSFPYSSLVASTNDMLWYINTWNSGWGQRRTFMFSNWNYVWDLAWNLYEHVNKANTISGLEYAANNTSFACFSPTWWSEWTGCSIDDRLAQSASVSSYNNSAQRIGQIYYSQGVPSNIFLRSGDWGTAAGLFTLALSWNANSTGVSVGFRCAK